MNWLKTVSELVSKLKNPKIWFGIDLSTIIILVFDWLSLVSLSEFHDLLKDFLIFTVIFISVLLLVNLTMSKWEICKNQKEIIKRIDSLCIGELDYLINCLKNNNTKFDAFDTCPNAKSLRTKSIVVPAYVYGELLHSNYYPYIVVDFVWDYLLKNKAQIIKKHEDEKQLERAAKRQKSKRVRY